MIRTTSVTETVVNLSGVPLPNVGTLATLITPGGSSPLDSAGDTIDMTPIPNLTNAGGVYLYDGTGTTGLIAPGDIYQNVGGSLVALPNCYWQITYLQTVRTSTSYTYTGSVINAGTWTAAVSNLGLLKVYMTDVFGNAQPITPSRGYTIALNADNVWSGGIGAGRNIPGGAGFGLSTDGTGTITAYLIRQSEFSVALSDWVLTDTTSGAIKYFTVPTTYTNDAGVYNSGTTYASGAVARRASDDEPFISLTSGNVGNPLTDGAHWANYAGEKITLLTVSVSPPGQQILTETGIAADTAVVTGTYAVPPATLQDQLRQLTQIQARHVTTATDTSTYDDDVLDLDGTSNAVAETLPSAVGWTKFLLLKCINITHAVTIGTTGGQTIDGATTLTPALNVAYLLYSDGANWRIGASPNIGASPLTTKGDLYTHTTVDTRLPVGADTSSLVADSTQASGLRWRAPTGAIAYNYWLGSMTGYKIGFGLSSDGRSFSRMIEPAISPGSGWESTWVKEPALVVPAGAGPINLYYAGYSDTGVTGHIGLAQSFDGGLTWTKSASNPILSPSQAWENNGSNSVQFPTVLYDLSETDATKRYKMWYCGGQQGVGGIGYAYSADGVSWTKYSGNPVLAPSGSGWEKTQQIPGAVVKLGSTYYLFYNGFIGGVNQPWQAGLATFTDPQGTYTKSAGNPLLIGDDIGGGLSSDISIGDTTIHVPNSALYPLGCPVWIYDDPSYTVYYLTYVTAQPTSTTLTVADAAPVAVSHTNGHVQSAAFGSVFIRSAWYDGGWQFGFTAFDPDPAQGVPELSMLAYADSQLASIRVDHSAGLIARPTAAEAQSAFAHVSLENPCVAFLTQAPRRYHGAASGSSVGTFVASGAGHAAGLVPDPGSTAGTTRYLREDATFAVPPGGTASIHEPVVLNPSAPIDFVSLAGDCVVL